MKLLLVIVFGFSSAALAQPLLDCEEDPNQDDCIVITDSAVPGANARLSESDLTNREIDNIHTALAPIPGVQTREEDAFGLRPNISIRGTSVERSAKITLMEDGILIAPAPYSAPAAYFFPLLTRMTAVELTKGPGAIRNGPATVGGALNMISTPIADTSRAEFDFALGSYDFTKSHGRLHLRQGGFGAMLEIVKLGAGGFKALDGGGATGFNKTEGLLKLRYEGEYSPSFYHGFTVRIGAADERSNETYLGLTSADFADTPNRRYRASYLDQMNWEHRRMYGHYDWRYKDTWSGSVDFYINRFHRVWSKFDDFAGGRSIGQVLSAPGGGINQALYQVLTGQRDSDGGLDDILIGTNDRTFSSNGIQWVSTREFDKWGAEHDAELGFRFHRDSISRNQSQATYGMRAGQLIKRDTAIKTNTLSVARVTAISLYGELQSRWRQWDSQLGVRVESIRNFFQDDLSGVKHTDWYIEVMPGGGLVYRPARWISFLGGLYVGFAPSAPSTEDVTSPEKSLNSELGVRLAGLGVEAEAIGFFTNYDNLRGTCTQSSGCDPAQIGNEFSAGNVWVWGAEVVASRQTRLSKSLTLPMSLSYTYTGSSFRTAFVSQNPLWGSVKTGDELPYLPAHQLFASIALEHQRFNLTVDGIYASATRDTAGQGAADQDDKTEAQFMINTSAWLDFGEAGRVYARIDNVFNRRAIVSRRPFGARPGKPFTLTVGYKVRFGD